MSSEKLFSLMELEEGKEYFDSYREERVKLISKNLHWFNTDWFPATASYEPNAKIFKEIKQKKSLVQYRYWYQEGDHLYHIDHYCQWSELRYSNSRKLLETEILKEFFLEGE